MSEILGLRRKFFKSEYLIGKSRRTKKMREDEMDWIIGIVEERRQGRVRHRKSLSERG